MCVTLKWHRSCPPRWFLYFYPISWMIRPSGKCKGLDVFFLSPNKYWMMWPFRQRTVFWASAGNEVTGLTSLGWDHCDSSRSPFPDVVSALWQPYTSQKENSGPRDQTQGYHSMADLSGTTSQVEAMHGRLRPSGGSLWGVTPSTSCCTASSRGGNAAWLVDPCASLSPLPSIRGLPLSI